MSLRRLPVFGMGAAVVASILAGCAGASEDDPARAGAITAAETAVRKEYPNDVFEVDGAERIDSSTGGHRWLVRFSFANEEGTACALVERDSGRTRETKLVECAFYED